jgi:aminoglycoside/choline kinase family phosphotransferase/dTDP-glucose pyrophosphorylase
MKALILAAGFGTRLKPYTDHLAKSLFPIAGQPNLDIVIRRLIDAGCDSIAVNTHHLHRQIEGFLSAQHYPIPVTPHYEPEISGTGGAIKNLEKFWDSRPFLVVNGDVVTDIDFKSIYAFHLSHRHCVTLALCDDPHFNCVSVDPQGFILGFSPEEDLTGSGAGLKTFTGIQVLDPVVLDFIPESRFSTSIDAYRKMMRAGHKIAAYHPDDFYWKDIGSPARYSGAVFDKMAPLAFKRAFPEDPAKEIEKIRLKGDGSDRAWYRLKTDRSSTLIMADHGIRPHATVCEVDAFVAIACHLRNKNIPVPAIHLHDEFSGLVFVEDFGDVHLQDVVRNETDSNRVLIWYKKVIDHMISMSVDGCRGFDPSWTYQTPCYDQALILEKECRYFVDAFLRGYKGMNVSFADLEGEFRLLAENVMGTACRGLMHRDLQSRNIMVKDGQIGFIDFQGARIGPLQYDLASLLIDPYAGLATPLRTFLLEYCFKKLSENRLFSEQTFFSGYRFCTLTRNLQMLGAFGFLSRQKGKAWFEQYIPAAVRTLKQSLAETKEIRLPRLTEVVVNSEQ